MARYRVSIQIASPDIIVEADDPGEAREIVNAFIECGGEGGMEWAEVLNSMDAEVDQIDEIEPEECIGLDAHQRGFHGLE